MSTRCAIAFGYDSNHTHKVALVYRHSDGYPSGAGADLLQFFEDVKAHVQRGDTRFDDPSYLAAKFIVWLTQMHAHSDWRKKRGDDHLLSQIGVGVLMDYPGDLEYVYVVVCKERDQTPQVFVHKTSNDGEPVGDPVALQEMLKTEAEDR